MERGITSFGAYVPKLRIERSAIAAAHAWSFPALKSLAKGCRALASWDEDTITMGVEAARGVRRDDVAAIVFASTSPPFADLQNAGLLAAALGLPNSVATLDAGGSLRAGSSALLQALRSADEASALVVAADARLAKPGSAQEMLYGAGAVAMTVGREGVIARLLGAASRADCFVDHFRAAGEPYDYFWEERWVRDEGYGKIAVAAAESALEAAGLQAADIRHFCMPSALAGVASATARKLGIDAAAVADSYGEACGDVGAAQGLMMLAGALEGASPGERLLLLNFGAGCDALIFEATESLRDYRPTLGVAAAIAGGRREPHYTKLLSFQGALQLDWGMRAEGGDKVSLTQQYRAWDQIARFAAGRCTSCGTVQFPRLATCVNCGSLEPLTPQSLCDEPARVFSYTADWLQFYPAPPLYFGMVQFDNGARVLMEMVDVAPDQLDVGTPLRMVFRIKSRDGERHYHRYFWKAAPMAPREA